MQAYIARTPNVSKKELERRQKECRGDQRLRIEARFGRNVRSLRKQRHLTQEELAALCHVHQHYISDIERGVRNVSLPGSGSNCESIGCTRKRLIIEEEGRIPLFIYRTKILYYNESVIF